MSALTITLIVLGSIFAVLQIGALIWGFAERMDTRSPESYLNMNANDVFAIFWYAWITGWVLANKYCERYDGNYKDGRLERRLEFADRRMNK